jgi:hypothetical protein
LLLAVLSPGALAAQEKRTQSPIKAVVLHRSDLVDTKGVIASFLVEQTEKQRLSSLMDPRKGKVQIDLTRETRLEKLVGRKRQPARVEDLKKGCRIDFSGYGQVLLSDPPILSPRSVVIIAAPK